MKQILPKITMMTKFPVKGYWFLPNHEENRIAGILNVEGDRFRLELFGSLNGNSHDEYLSSLEKEQSKNTPAIFGRGANGEGYSLLNCIPGASSLNLNSEFPLTSFIVGDIVAGCFLEDPNEAIFKKIRVQYSHLQEWLGFTGITRTSVDESGFSLEYKYPEPIAIAIDDQYKFTLNYKYDYQGKDQYRREINQDVFVDIESQISVSYLELSKQISLFCDFLSLATLSEVKVAAIKLFWNMKGEHEHNRPITLDVFLEPPLSYTPTVKHFSKFLFSFNQVDHLVKKLLENWLHMDGDLWPIRRYLIENIKPNNVFAVNNFLNIVQSLEGFHRRFRYAKQKGLSDRLLCLHDEFCHLSVISSAFVNKTEIFKQVVDSRHYYSHFYKKDSDDILDGKELYYVTKKIKLLLVACFLNQIGFDNDIIEVALTKV
ncbi:hypothetical protein MUK70_15065 [Dyadobacter chenwenxiniae]|uniref:ApeA N-terminal domain-containing protein n=1 Tax=Dyadobacter chenwenxiniae TaxID=2906456 RepID=A0A9X1PFT6_9BACT|nr:HEPN domain-containing protein [Dyadobacter chenwenxiniae]MCF0060562.1 hypothetical protein [Dyadobacter chenwenxiniae]UON86293.1 hypothetical protein MUK70_15065 [Dyadobacter chenwenxiniae]